MTEKQEKKDRKFIAYAPFEFGGKQYKAGDEFALPAGLVRDPAFEQFRNMGAQQGDANGLAFSQTLPPLTPKGDPYVRRVILPLKEA